MGSAAARYLAEAGEDVVVVGPEEPADFARHPGPFASHYDEGRQAEFAAHNEGISRLSRASANAFRGLQAKTGVEFYRDHPNLWVMPRGFRTDYLDLDRCEALAKQLDETLVPLDDAGLAQRFPEFRFPADSRGLLEPRGGLINPRRMVQAQLAAARKAGATLVADDVVALKRRPGAIELATRGGETLRAERVLVAIGVHGRVDGLFDHPRRQPPPASMKRGNRFPVAARGEHRHTVGGHDPHGVRSLRAHDRIRLIRLGAAVLRNRYPDAVDLPRPDHVRGRRDVTQPEAMTHAKRIEQRMTQASGTHPSRSRSQ